ncbi:thermonuclease family protein [Frigidibacter albus]|uniref:Thermonuclease family protein n=1 Tax=Frigidibacter albus TaxID=1465486 RepID=A0A6L8VKB3_9RHOB|nr:thermonuclease family protein [Frigidibacter albus]MZQ89809.1 thermonuclease family protein [Frigidibacter albus]NBE31816.1 thermonuclease family protein [Frigidibacter albus]GGH56554.1 nuclease [Frigidibacter albus]
MLTLRSLFGLALLTALLAGPAGAQTVAGSARIIDGDTVEVEGVTVRLYGIDAPEMSQSCTREGRAWACGAWARDVLAELARGGLRCKGREQDRYGRLVATCTGAGGDVAAQMVAQGAAFAYRQYSLDYVDAEKRAAVAGIGLWEGEVERPDAFRAAGRAPAQAVPGDCAIKGNISSRGRIYHVPGSRSWADTRIDTGAGERWFCTEAEAQAAGWRRAGG